MCPDDLSYGFADLRDPSRVLQHADWWVISDLSINVFKLVVAIEFHFPAELPQLLGKTGVYQVYRALVDACFWLQLNE